MLCDQCGHVNYVGGSGAAAQAGSGGVASGTGARPPSGILKATSVDLGGDADENASDDPAARRKDLLVAELRETNSILDAKSRKLEQLVRLKDAKIQTLLNKLQALGALRPE